MLHRVSIGIVATVACLLTAEDALGQFFYRIGGQQPWSVVSQSQPFYWNSSPWNGGGYSYTYYTGTVTLPGWDASGYAPRMRATLEPAVSMDQAASQTGIAAVAFSAGERDSIRPASSYADALIPRSVAGPAVRYGTSYGSYGHVAPASCYGCQGAFTYGYR